MSSLHDQLQKFHQTPAQQPDSQQVRLVALLAKLADRDPATIDGTMQLLDDLGLQSLDIIELAVRLEQEFSIPVERDMWQPQLRVQELFDRLEQH